MLRQPTNLYRQSSSALSRPRTFCQITKPLTIKDPGWSDYFAPGCNIKSDCTYYWAPRSFSTSRKTGFSYEDMFGPLDWRWVELPDGENIAWEATTVYMRTRSRKSIHPFRYIPTSFIKRSSLKVSIGAVIPINLGTACLDRLGLTRKLDQKGMSLLIRSLYSENSTSTGRLNEHDLYTIMSYIDWDLPALEPRHSWTRNCETTHHIQMIGIARIFKQLFNCQVQE